ncbi:MAG: class I SAM-dependent methyltransferase [Dehalococcoidia bacterium]
MPDRPEDRWLEPRRNAATPWQAFYDGHAPFYLQNVFTRNTLAEVDLIVDLFRLPAGARVVDVGCGAGRHAVELARRGYMVTGVDISAGMLDEARRLASTAGVRVDWVHADAREFVASEPFEAAVCLCEGALGMLSLDEDPEAYDRAILAAVHRALKPGAPFLLTTLNGYRRIREVTQDQVESGEFDPVTMVHYLDEQWDVPGGKRRMVYKERLYIPPELVRLLESAGFAVEHVWGGTAGNWGRRKILLDEIEVMVVARRR